MVTELQKIIFNLKNRGLGILITDHNVSDTLDITDRAYIISEGCVLESGTPHEIAESKGVRKVYLGDKFQMGYNKVNERSVMDRVEELKASMEDILGELKRLGSDIKGRGET
jgi:ABC-type multidrug transport system ATPase subunit